MRAHLHNSRQMLKIKQVHRADQALLPAQVDSFVGCSFHCALHPPPQKMKTENGVKSTIQTDPCDYKGHTHTQHGCTLQCDVRKLFFFEKHLKLHTHVQESGGVQGIVTTEENSTQCVWGLAVSDAGRIAFHGCKCVALHHMALQNINDQQ